MRWLEDAGADPNALATLTHQDLFFQAYSAGDESQASVLLFWYTDNRRGRVQGFSFLIDYNPPWEGAVKDIIPYPKRSPEVAIAEFVERWKFGMRSPEPIGPEEAKQEIL